MNQNPKPSLRKHFLNLRLNVKIDFKPIITNLDLYLAKQDYKTIGLYYPINNEIDIINILPFIDSSKTISLPRIHDNEIHFYNWNRKLSDLIPNEKFNLREPKAESNNLVKPDIIITPLIAFDHQLYRLGYGGGYYDRYFTENTNVIKVGIASNIQKSTTLLPVESHDIKLDAIITESGSPS